MGHRIPLQCQVRMIFGTRGYTLQVTLLDRLLVI
jgi:hypothetical protein